MGKQKKVDNDQFRKNMDSIDLDAELLKLRKQKKESGEYGLYIKSIIGAIHDTGFGGYPYKVVVNIEVDSKEFNKLKGDLGALVLEVNNAVYKINRNIPSYIPSIDSKGSTRAKNGIKKMEFVYFFNDHERAEKLGFKIIKLKNGDCYPKNFQYINLLKEAV